ncbi:kinase-like domain-containing protein [Ephemerocybe angulata]|uniref:Kinase-like domain-containing protein n=1 Tax=Ephemerocybe angulata TaxID=980116 RepID=A0A8H6IAF0_9AGAR|nr:kinase-like domain-containing protein [Tulosesus angulatus]
MASTCPPAQQIFALQPNRTFFRTLIVTEKRVRLAHYDRGGMYLTPFINYHSNPTTLILFMLGLTSHDESNLGLDTSVQWTSDPDTGRKVAGTLEAPNVRGETVVYNLNMEKTPFVRPGIVGRGTTCWHATDPDTGKSVLIKDAWRGGDRASESENESEFLADARGIPGIVQMISHQGNCAAASDFRPSDFKANAGYQNRIKARVVLEECAEPIWNFTSRHQVISALRDAIAAHRKLVERGIIHRDISPWNILLGHPGAPEGLRGILIDLDMAMRAESGMSLDEVDPQTGTRTYQSISVLLANDPRNDPIPPHDYLDDLESFLYVLCHILLGFKKPGEPSKPTPDLIAGWDDPDAKTAMTNKVVLMAEGYPEYEFPQIEEFWGPPCRELLEGMRVYIADVVYQKSKIRAKKSKVSTDERFEMWAAFVEKNLVRSYDHIDSLFRTALAEIAREDAEDAVQAHAESQTSPRADCKRSLEEEPQPTLPRKRTRRHA